MFVYIYMYTYTCISLSLYIFNICMYLYIHQKARERDRDREGQSKIQSSEFSLSLFSLWKADSHGTFESVFPQDWDHKIHSAQRIRARERERRACESKDCDSCYDTFTCAMTHICIIILATTCNWYILHTHLDRDSCYDSFKCVMTHLIAVTCNCYWPQSNLQSRLNILIRCSKSQCVAVCCVCCSE